MEPSIQSVKYNELREKVALAFENQLLVFLPESAVKPLPLGMGIQGVLLGLTGVVVDTY